MNSPYQSLKFPLNVYAHSLYLQEGRAEYLQFGLFNAADVSMTAAQQQAMQTLIEALPAPPSRILEMGSNTSTMRKRLQQLGYQLAHQTTGYDALVCHEAAHTLHGISFFNQAYAALVDKGQLVLLDCFGVQRNPDAPDNSPPLLPYTLAQLQRCGFTITLQQDLTKVALPSFAYWLAIFAQYQAELSTALGVSKVTLRGLCQQLQYQQQQFEQQQQVFTLLVAEKTAPPRWRLTPVTAQEAPAMQRLFAQVFAPQQMSEAFWQWKYAAPRGLGMAAWNPAGEMVAHYGGIVREIHCFGELKAAVQITDVMVASQDRAVFTKRGAFFLVTANFLEDYIGYGYRTWLGYGFPSGRHVQLAAKQGLYAVVGQMLELHYPVSDQLQPHYWTRIRHLNADSQADRRRIDRLWQRMAQDLMQNLVGVRNAAHMIHRYLQHPHKHYEVLLISQRFTGVPLALVVLHREGEICKWMDYVGALRHLPLALQQIQRMAGRWGLSQVQVWITANCEAYFPSVRLETITLEIQVPHNVWSQLVSADTIKDRWWLMMGDTDFL